MTSICTTYLKGCRCPKCEARTQADPVYRKHLVLVQALNNPAPQKISDAFEHRWRDPEPGEIPPQRNIAGHT